MGQDINIVQDENVYNVAEGFSNKIRSLDSKEIRRNVMEN